MSRYSLRGPCKSCPFRGDGTGVGYLRPGRILALRNVQDFACHQTVDYDREDSDCIDQTSKVCGGWLAMQWRHDGGFLSLPAMAARVGSFDPTQLRVDDVFDSWQACEDHQRIGKQET